MNCLCRLIHLLSGWTFEPLSLSIPVDSALRNTTMNKTWSPCPHGIQRACFVERNKYILPIAFCRPPNSLLFLDFTFLREIPFRFQHQECFSYRFWAFWLRSTVGVFLLKHWFVFILHCDSRIDSSYLSMQVAGTFVIHSQKIHHLWQQGFKY